MCLNVLFPIFCSGSLRARLFTLIRLLRMVLHRIGVLTPLLIICKLLGLSSQEAAVHLDLILKEALSICLFLFLGR